MRRFVQRVARRFAPGLAISGLWVPPLLPTSVHVDLVIGDLDATALSTTADRVAIGELHHPQCSGVSLYLGGRRGLESLPAVNRRRDVHGVTERLRLSSLFDSRAGVAVLEGDIVNCHPIIDGHLETTQGRRFLFCHVDQAQNRLLSRR
jgi:hypothetical protein